MTYLDRILEEAFKLFSELVALQKNYISKIVQPRFSLSESELTQHLKEGKILLNFHLPLIDPIICSELRQEICRLIAKHRPERKFQIQKIDSYLKEHPYVFENFLEKDWNLLLAEELLLEEKELLNFVIYQTVRPFLQKYALQNSSFIKGDQWLRDYCLVCGEKPTFSYLRAGDGKRVLVCPLCGSEWIYRYLVCTWCGNEEHRSFRYFEVAEITGYEVYVCEKCRGYLKTYNEKKGTGHDDWPLEDVKTIILDMLAFREGFTRPGAKLLH